MQILRLACMVLPLTGCIANWAGVYTIEEIQRSETKAVHTSMKTQEVVTRCLMDTLYRYQTETGKRPYQGVVQQTIGSTLVIQLRQSTGLVVQAVTLHGEGELLFVIEVVLLPTGGTTATIWVNHMMMSSQRYLTALNGVVQPCFA